MYDSLAGYGSAPLPGCLRIIVNGNTGSVWKCDILVVEVIINVLGKWKNQWSKDKHNIGSSSYLVGSLIQGVASSIPARSHTFVEIDYEIISTVILLPSADSFKKGCCQLQAKVCAQITG